MERPGGGLDQRCLSVSPSVAAVRAPQRLQLSPDSDRASCQMKRLFLVVASLLFVICGTPHYTILGADGWGWNASIVTVLSDIEINALKVRHVRLENGGCKGGFKDHLELSGPIGPDSSEVVDRVLQKVPRCDNSTGNGWTVPIVYLNSPGGQLKHGFQLGQTLRKYQAQAVITKGQQCASSCAIAFLGARFRLSLIHI